MDRFSMEIGLTVFNRAPSQPDYVEDCDDLEGAQRLVQYCGYRPFLSG